MITDHPLLSYIEDPFIVDHVAVYKKMQAKLKESSNVELCLNASALNHDLEKIRELTQYITPEEDDDETRSRNMTASPDMAMSEASSPSKSGGEKEKEKTKSKDKPKEKGKKEEKTEEVKEEGPPDINANKYVPGAIRVAHESSYSINNFQ